jgi:hypothetical protein
LQPYLRIGTAFPEGPEEQQTVPNDSEICSGTNAEGKLAPGNVQPRTLHLQELCLQAR